MDPVKLLATVVYKFRNEQDEVFLSEGDALAAINTDHLNLLIRQTPEGLYLKAVDTRTARGEQNAQRLELVAN